MYSKRECPVPFDQQPINEYLALKKTWLFNYSILDVRQYILALSSLFFLSVAGICLYLLYFYANYFTILKSFSLSLCLVDFIFFVLFLRLYLGWSYVLKRLLSATIFYEESGWYDGQIWVKQADNLTKDRLIGIYYIVPTINRLKYTFYMIVFNFICNIFACYLL